SRSSRALLVRHGGRHSHQGADHADGGRAHGSRARGVWRPRARPASILAASPVPRLGRAADARRRTSLVHRNRRGDAWIVLRRGGDGPPWFVRLAGITLAIAAGIMGLGATALPVFVRPQLVWTNLLGLPVLAAAIAVAWLMLRAVRMEDWPRAAWTGLLTVP